jgi:hypothetical protein
MPEQILFMTFNRPDMAEIGHIRQKRANTLKV